MMVGAMTVAMADSVILRWVASTASMLLIVSTVEDASSEAAEPSLVTVTSASIELVPTAAVTVSFRSAASALLSTVVAGIVELEFSSTASVAANDVDVRLRRAPIQRRRWRRALIAMTEQPVFGGSPQMFFWSAAATRSIDEAMAVRSMFIVVTCLMRT